MRVSVETVKSHLYQARQQLKEKMADYFEDFEI
jgi:DNA-directed RNA polymerase specialized sigma24 family protein